jgi:hypothetical protein
VSGGLLVASLLIKAIRDHGWAAYFLLTLGVTLAGLSAFHSINRNTDGLARTEHRQYVALVGSCQRVNTLRRNDNRIAVDDYQADRESYFTNVTAARFIPDRRVARRFSVLAGDAMRRAKHRTWIPATDCASAVDTPEQFKAPVPRPVWLTPKRLIPR